MVCGKLVNSDRLNAHRVTHNKDKLFECILCYAKLTSNSNLWSHNKTIHKSQEEQELLKNGLSGEQKYPCDKCEYKFFTENLLETHKKKAHNATPLKPALSAQSKAPVIIECNLCYVRYPRQSNLKEHRERVHPSVEEWAMFNVGEIKASFLKHGCQFCSKKFFNLSSLKHHRLIAHKKEMRRDENSEISCEFCGRAFKWKNKANLKTHMKKIHDIKDYDVTEHGFKKPEESNTVNNFMNFLSSLQ